MKTILLTILAGILPVILVCADDPTTTAFAAIRVPYELSESSCDRLVVTEKAAHDFDQALDAIATGGAGTRAVTEESASMEAKLTAIALARRTRSEDFTAIAKCLTLTSEQFGARNKYRAMHWPRGVSPDSPYAREQYRLAWEYWLLRPHVGPENGIAPSPAVLANMQNCASLVTLEYLFQLTTNSASHWNHSQRIDLVQAIGGFQPEAALPLLIKCLMWSDRVGDTKTIRIGELILREEKFRPHLENLTLGGLTSNVVTAIENARAYQQPNALPAPPPKIDYFAPMLKELRDLGYDLEMDDETEARFGQDLVDYVWKQTEARQASGASSYDEMKQEQARRYKEWWIKNMKPTLPPRTNDTSTVTTPFAP